MSRESTVYRGQEERDACGLGFIVDLNGARSRRIVELLLDAGCSMNHRSGIVDGTTGDGAGLLLEIPWAFFSAAFNEQSVAKVDAGSALAFEPRGGSHAIGVFYMPQSADRRTQLRQTIEAQLKSAGLRPLAWRVVPTALDEIGERARKTCPCIEQVLVECSSAAAESGSVDAVDRALYFAQKGIEHAVDLQSYPEFYLCSLSSRVVVYKGMLAAPQIRHFFPDLSDSRFEISWGKIHTRFSTNTSTRWPLAHPFRMISHNGEVNTLRGNKNRLASLEGSLRRKGIDEKLLPLMQPGGSDSATLDNALQAIVLLSGRSISHAMRMLIPCAWENDENLSDEVRSFYAYHALFTEPWDGPACVVFADGREIGAVLDRNGLRPARYLRTHDGLFICGSETGIVPIPADEIVEKGRLGPGQMVAVALEGERRVRYDAQLVEELAHARPYIELVSNACSLHAPQKLSSAPRMKEHDQSTEDGQGSDGLSSRSSLVTIAGITEEDIYGPFATMVRTRKEMIFSMGDDTPPAVLSSIPRPLDWWFVQVHAQVTNPPIDPLREARVFSLAVPLGGRPSVVEPVDEVAPAGLVALSSPFLYSADFRTCTDSASHAKPTHIDATVPISPSGLLRSEVDRLMSEAEQAVLQGSRLLVLSDRSIGRSRMPIPALLAVGAVHHHLRRKGLRNECSLIVQSAEVFDTHHYAALLGYGAEAVHPWLAEKLIIEDLSIREKAECETALENFRAAMNNGLKKVMSKMGICVVTGYIGAQVFDALGLGEELIDLAFEGTSSPIGGIGFAELESIYRSFHERARTEKDGKLVNHGRFKYRPSGEEHGFGADVVKILHRFFQTRSYESYLAVVERLAEKRPLALRSLLDWKRLGHPIEQERVEGPHEIVRRFRTAAISLGAISPEAHQTLALAMNELGAMSNCGEGGEAEERLFAHPGAPDLRSRVRQVASGRFGVSTSYAVGAEELEIKMAQGSKAGEGGQIPGFKVLGVVAKTRNVDEGTELISPPPHHDIYSIEDLAQLIRDLKRVNPRARISVKLVSISGVGVVAVGVAKAGADIIHISGGNGGTGASPLTSIKHAGSLWELGLAEAHQALARNGIRQYVTLRVDGGFVSGRDVVIASMLGADEFGFGTAALIIGGRCVMLRACHNNTCGPGVATQDPKRRANFQGNHEDLVHFFLQVAEHVRAILAELGFTSLQQLIGRYDLLTRVDRNTVPYSELVDLRLLLEPADLPAGAALCRTFTHNPLGAFGSNLERTLFEAVSGVIESREETVQLEAKISNHDLTVGAGIAGEICWRRLGEPLPERSIDIRFTGSAGQSFGAFLVGGMHFHLTGDANDGAFKALSGGVGVIVPPDDALYEKERSTIVGNAALYGATSGAVFVRGAAGERFAVRNSGALAVVQRAGRYCCEYMTRGTVVVLGPVEDDFAAGMTGGVAYVLDPQVDVPGRFSSDVALSPLAADDIELLREILVQHRDYTGSQVAVRLLESGSDAWTRFKKVRPVQSSVPKPNPLPVVTEERQRAVGG